MLEVWQVDDAARFDVQTAVVYFEGDPWLNSDTINSVKEPLVVALERLPADGRWDRPHARCTFDVKLRPIG
jgi:hypothetical protein